MAVQEAVINAITLKGSYMFNAGQQLVEYDAAAAFAVSSGLIDMLMLFATPSMAR